MRKLVWCGLLIWAWGCGDDATGTGDDAGLPVEDSGPPAPDPNTPAPFDGATPDDCITDVNPGDYKLECEGLTFDLSVPDACVERACGLIVDVHGFGMTGQSQDDHSGLSALGQQHGYIVVNPYAPGGVLSASWSAANDAQVLAFMQRVIAAFDVDARRVHMSGYSQGGFMTWRFLCKNSDLLASVAPMAAGGAMACDLNATPPEVQRPVFQVHGTTDGLVAFESGTGMRDDLIPLWSLEETEVVSQDDEHTWTRYENADGIVYEFVEHDWECGFSLNGRPLRGHCFPGSAMLLGCGEDTAFHWGEEVMQFFRDHPRLD